MDLGASYAMGVRRILRDQALAELGRRGFISS